MKDFRRAVSVPTFLFRVSGVALEQKYQYRVIHRFSLFCSNSDELDVDLMEKLILLNLGNSMA